MSNHVGSQAGRANPLIVRDVCKAFRTPTGHLIQALDRVSFDIDPGTLTALVGPDGAGKTTLLRIATGLYGADAGQLQVLGLDPAVAAARVQAQIAYMPQRFGLYEDLSVQENLNLYAALHGVTEPQKRERFPKLLHMAGLAMFAERLAGRLSGGMKQKLGLACTLVGVPELLLLDEPTVGVDPLSRRELWEIIPQLTRQRGLTVLLSTSYLDEAERCDRAIVLHEGRVLAQGMPADVRKLASRRTFIALPPPGHSARGLQARLIDSPKVLDAVPEGGRVRFIVTDAYDGDARPNISPADAAGVEVMPIAPRFEDGFMTLLRQASPEAHPAPAIALERPLKARLNDIVVEVRGLVRRFGGFTAVDHVDFAVHAGEIFGLLGPNGAGKTTTFRMLCGLLPATAGTLRVAGVDLRTARASARQRIGYVAQKFSLYGQLTVCENLEFFASAYGLRGTQRRRRIDWALQQFELSAFAATASEQLPGGFKRRLAMAAALLHEPDTLFLDEPTSGADPMARREFWRGITGLAEQGVTVVVTTHFMEEAEYCDHVAILDQGKVLAQGTPAQLRRHGLHKGEAEADMEEAFIRIVESARTQQHPNSTPLGKIA